MFTALLSFLGGGVFRMIIGEASAWLTKWQDHKQEVERMRLQGDLDAAQHARNLEAIRVQAELGVKTIQVQSEADAGRLEVEGWAHAAADATKPIGILLVDAWNGSIRPLCATIAVWLWVVALNAAGWKMGDWDRELVGVILGFYFVSRQLQKSGK